MKLLIQILVFVVAAAAFSGCSGAEDAPVRPGGDDGRKGTYLRLSVNMAGSASRADGDAVANGYGEENGVRHENDIDNLTLFFYRADGPNADADFKFARFVIPSEFTVTGSGNDKTIDIEIVIDSYTPADGDRIIAVANMGNLTSVASLGELRSRVLVRSWTSAADLADYSRFAMSSTYSSHGDDGRVNIKGGGEAEPGSRDNPFFAHLFIERTAARIDYGYYAAQVKDGEIVYTVPDPANAGADKAQVYVSHAMPVNVMQKPSYVLKHVTEGLSDDYSAFNSTLVCSPEYRDAAGRPTNYVVDPYTALKSAEPRPEWYGATAITNVRANAATLFTDATSLKAPLADSRIAVPYSYADFAGDRSLVLSYSEENTFHVDASHELHATGVVLKARYIPTYVYRLNAKGELEVDLTWQPGDDMWRYAPADAVRDEGKSYYFSNALDANTWRSSHPETAGEITAYPACECYYTLRLRHNLAAAPAGADRFAMQYATVRNHIYRFTVEFSGPGTPSVDVNDPVNVDFRIFVRKWNLRFQSEIIM